MSGFRAVSLLVTLVLLWTVAGMAQESEGQADGTTALASAEASLELSRSERRQIQMGLVAEGFDPGPADGLFHQGTRGAIRKWQALRCSPAARHISSTTPGCRTASKRFSASSKTATARSATSPCI